MKKNKEVFGNVICPKCGHTQRMKIPTTSCQAFYTCNGCGETIKAGDTCCIFCDYSDEECPYMKEHKK